MSITTYTELKTAVASFLHRDDLTSIIPDFITLAEDKISRVSRLTAQETEVAVSLTSGNSTASLPTGFLELIDGELYYDEDLYQLDILDIGDLRAKATTGTGRPSYCAITGTVFQFEMEADQTYAMTCRHWKKWDIASDATNWLLTNHRGAYLFNALAEAAPYLKNDSRVPLWVAKGQQVLDELEQMSAKNRSKAKLQMPFGLAHRRYANIETDG